MSINTTQMQQPIVASSFLNQHVQNWLVGGASGAMGAFVSQPAYNWMLDVVKNKRWSVELKKGNIQLLHPRILFGGAVAGMMGEAVNVSTANLSNEQLKKRLPPIWSSLTAGAIAGATLTVFEIAMDYHRQNVSEWQKQQKSGHASRSPHYIDTLRKLVKKQGYRALLSGIKCTMAREALTTSAWAHFGDLLADKCATYVPHPFLAKLSGGILAGGSVALFIQPLNAARINIQNGISTGFAHDKIVQAVKGAYAQKKHSGKFKAATEVAYAACSDLYKGTGPRTVVTVIYIAGTYLTYTFFSDAVKKLDASLQKVVPKAK